MFLVGVFLVGTIFFYLVGPSLVPLISPLWKTENAITRTIGGGFELLRSKQALVEENAILRERLISMELEISTISSAKEQEETLFRALGRTESSGGVLASVLVRPPQSLYDFLLVDAGSEDGVSLGAKVYMPEGPELGVVSEVFSNQARIKLGTSSGEKTGAVLERHGVPVVLEGVGAGNFRIRVPRETEVVVGDRILSATIEGNLLAIVGDITLQPTDSFKEVLAKSPWSIFSNRFVLIRP